MFDVSTVTLAEINAEYSATLDKLERLSKLREAVADQDRRRIEQLIKEYNNAQKAEERYGARDPSEHIAEAAPSGPPSSG